MKNNIKKIIIIFVIIAFAVSGIFIYKNVNDNMKTLSKKEINEILKNTKYLKVKYLAMEKNDDEYNLDDVFPDHFDDYQSFTSEYIVLNKEGNFYTANLKGNVNQKILDSVTDSAFAMNNNKGEVIDDCIYNKDSFEIKVPKEYFEKEYDEVEKITPVQMELLSRLNESEIKNLEITLNTKNVTNKKTYIEKNGRNDSFTVATNKNKKNIKIFLNNSKNELTDNYYTYNKKTGTITFNISPMLVNNIKIDYSNDKISFINKTSAIIKYSTTSSQMNVITLNSAPSKTPKVNDGGVTGLMTYQDEDLIDSSNVYNVYVNPFVDMSAFDVAGGLKTPSEAWAILNESYFNMEADSVRNKVFDVIAVNPSLNFGYDYNNMLYYGTNCVHIKVPSTTPPINAGGVTTDGDKIGKVYNYKWKVSNVYPADSSGYTSFSVVFMLHPDQYYWTGVSSSTSTGQTLMGILKFRYLDSKAKIVVDKKFLDGSTDVTNTISDKSGVEFKLYSDSTCSTELQTGTTDTNGSLSFENLSLNTTYYVKETSLGSKFSSNDWEMDPDSTNKCHSVTVTTDNSKDSNNIYYNSLTINNRKKYYCYRAKKVDDENQNCAISEIKFTNDGGDEKTTGSDGIVTFEKLSYATHKLKETSENNSLATLHCADSTKSYHYWNNNSSDQDIASSSLTQMTWNGSNYSCPDSATTYAITKKDRKQYYCMKVKKVDAMTGETLSGAKFKATMDTLSYEATTDDNGIATFLVGTNDGTYTITETQAPAGYMLPTGDGISKSVSTTLMTSDTTSATAQDVSKCNASAEEFTFKDSKILLNWYKETEQQTPVSEAEFKVSNGNEYLKVKEKANVTDQNGTTKSCYQYSGLTSNEGEASILASDSNGEVCISGLDSGTYTVRETKPVEYHTFDSKDNISISTNINFNTKSESNKFINYETIFEFNKSVSYGDGDDKIIVNGVEKSFTELTTEELKKIDFEVYKRDDNGNPTGSALPFVLVNGVYEYNSNNKDHINGNEITKLNLNDNRKITIKHLAWGNYIIKEVNSKTCGGSDDDCIGYYYPNNENEKSFTITSCSNSKANKTSCSLAATTTQNMINIPTEITFTKSDFYKYYDEKDVVDFENDKERSDFDRIVFKLKDSNGNYLTLKKIANHGNCLTDDSYSEYRYVYGDTTDKGGTELNTCGGHIKITNLCRGNNYTIEEISVPEDSVFVKENTESTPTEANYTIPCKEGDVSSSTTTNVINDKPTRVRFEKRDSKYNYLIPDETTTFKVYKCKKGTTCHPSDGVTDDMELVKFSPRSVINKDEEDPNDAEDLAGVEVYRRMSDSDVKDGADYVTELHPYHGILVLRYLEANYNYVLLETVAPKNYTLPIGRNAETAFTVTNTTVSVDEVDVPNKPTSLLIRKYDDKGNLLPGAEFKVYEGKTCDKNLSAMNQPKTLLKLKTIRDGVYESRPEQDTDVVITCKDKENSKCSDIPVNDLTKLTYTSYLGTWADFKESENSKNEKIELQEGEALIQYLEYNHCYIIEEVKAPEGYSLTKKDSDRFTMVTIEKNEKYVADTFKDLVNKPTPFTFYKYDEYNNLIDGAEFKLQKLDNNKKYNDVTVSEIIENDKKYYKVDKNTDNTLITTLNGSATVYYLSAGQYRIVETKAPEGKELTKNPNIATFFVDDSGNVYGNSIIVNKEKTSKIEVKSTASAELIVNIQTGQTVIKYSLIIAILIAIISGLMIIKNKGELEARKDEKSRKKDKNK